MPSDPVRPNQGVEGSGTVGMRPMLSTAKSKPVGLSLTMVKLVSRLEVARSRALSLDASSPTHSSNPDFQSGVG